MKIITYNVNGLRAAVGKGLPEWLAQEQPDVLCLQETKLQPEQYAAEAFEALGYKAWLFSAQKKGYSGVAILSRREPDHVEYGMGIEKYDNEGRFIRADFGDLSVISVYHPSGTSGDERQAFKMEWLEDFQNYVVELQKSRPKLILCGDYNICHEPIDIHDPVRNATNSGFLPEEREWMTRFLDAGYIDTFRLLNPDKQEYTARLHSSHHPDARRSAWQPPAEKRVGLPAARWRSHFFWPRQPVRGLSGKIHSYFILALRFARGDMNITPQGNIRFLTAITRF